MPHSPSFWKYAISLCDRAYTYKNRKMQDLIFSNQRINRTNNSFTSVKRNAYSAFY